MELLKPYGMSPEAIESFEPELAGAAELGVTDELLAVKREIEFAMANRSVDTVSQSMHEGNPKSGGNIIGVGIGSAKRDLDQISPDGPGAPTLNIYVVTVAGQEDVRRALADEFGQDAFNQDGRPLNIIGCGIIESQQHQFSMKPSPCGISVGNPLEIDAGTLGFVARGRSGERRDRLFVVTNNHVIARRNQGGPSDQVCQPGKYDDPHGRKIGFLERYVKIDFTGQDNFVDCACAWVDPDEVQPEHIYVANGQRHLFKVSDQPVDAVENLTVGKSGRTTGLTAGRVIDLAATINVNMQGRVARFRDVIAITGLDGRPFSLPGDSGSLVWTHDAARQPVGLIFAGGTRRDVAISFAIPVRRVLEALDIELFSG